jgi:hypothetical protein
MVFQEVMPPLQGLKKGKVCNRISRGLPLWRLHPGLSHVAPSGLRNGNEFHRDECRFALEAVLHFEKEVVKHEASEGEPVESGQ